MKNLHLKQEFLVSRIHLIRGQKVMLDRDLALLYDVTTGNLNKAVKRNLKRFPSDFMFRLTASEQRNLIFQIGISSWGGSRKMPFAFTELGVAMLSSILKSERAIRANIHIMRMFSRLRHFVLDNKEMISKLRRLEKRVGSHDDHIRSLFQYLKQMVSPESSHQRRIGFRQQGREGTLRLLRRS